MKADEGMVAEIERRIVSKVNWRVMSIFMLGYLISFVDRANLGVLAAPISKALNLSAATFGLAAGVFYIGYLLFAIPSNMAIVRLGGRFWMGCIMAGWGLVCFGLAATHSESWLYGCRILLGVTEAGFYPGAMFLMTLWYPPRALAKAYAAYTAFTPLALVFGALATSALLSLNGIGPIADWRLVFVLEGIPAFLLGIYTWLALPSGPKDAKWLSAEEKAYLAAQIPELAKAEPGDATRALLKTLTDPFSWLFALLYFLMLLGYWGLIYFMPRILQSRFHTDPVHAGFISTLPWLFACVLIYALGKSSAITGERRWHMATGLILSGVGLYLAASTDSSALTLLGLCLGAGGAPAAAAFFWTMPATVFAGATVAIAMAMVNSVGNLSGFAGPWVIGVLTDLSGDSRLPLYVLAGMCILAAALAFTMATIVQRRGASWGVAADKSLSGATGH